MARLVTPLTATKINAAKPKEKLYKLTDGGGLALWVLPSGKKTWRFEYRRPDKKLDTITIGSYPEFSLADAREIREQYRAMTAKGIDPKLADNGEAVTLKAVYELWSERWQTTVSTGYAIKMFNALDLNVMPTLGKWDIQKIKPKNVVETLLPMEARGSLEQLRKTKQILRQVFDFAVARGLCDFNPVASVSNKAFKKPESTHYSALKPEQLPNLIDAVYNRNLDFVTQHCIMWQLLTLCRPSEATNAAWSEIDFENKIWTIPEERMKTNRKHVVPLSSLAFDIINEVHKFTGNCEFVFVGRNFKRPINRETPRIALRRFKDLGLDTTSHGLRALARTCLEESGLWRFEAIEAALAHIEERRKMLEWWGEEVRKFMN